MTSALPAQALPAAARAPAAPRRPLRLQFTGTGDEYFRIWIVNLLLSVLTLGIYSAWAKVRRERWFLGNTLLDGSPFDYHASPVAILKGRILVASFVIGVNLLAEVNIFVNLFASLAFMLMMPWVIARALAFRAANTSWRGLRFRFGGKVGESFIAYLLIPMLAGITLGWIWPLAAVRQRQYVYNDLSFGGAAFRLRLEPRPVYAIFAVLWLGIFIAILFTGIATALLGPKLGPLVKGLGLPRELLAGLFTAALFLLPYAVYTLVQPYWSARMALLTFDGLSCGPHRFYCDQTAGGLLRIVLRNTLLTLLTLGLYRPYAVVNLWRYRTERLALLAAGDLDEFVADAAQAVAVTGEEAGDFFDVDFGL